MGGSPASGAGAALPTPASTSGLQTLGAGLLFQPRRAAQCRSPSDGGRALPVRSLCPWPAAAGMTEVCEQCLELGPSRHRVSPASAPGAQPTPAPTPAPRCQESCMLCSCSWGPATVLALSEFGQVLPPSKGRWPRRVEPSSGSGLWAQSWFHGRQDRRLPGVDISVGTSCGP